jgi:hypothetical protein
MPAFAGMTATRRRAGLFQHLLYERQPRPAAAVFFLCPFNQSYMKLALQVLVVPHEHMPGFQRHGSHNAYSRFAGVDNLAFDLDLLMPEVLHGRGKDSEFNIGRVRKSFFFASFFFSVHLYFGNPAVRIFRGPVALRPTLSDGLPFSVSAINYKRNRRKMPIKKATDRTAREENDFCQTAADCAPCCALLLPLHELWYF